MCVHSIDLVRAVLLAYDVPVEEMEVFMKDLSEGRRGMSLVFTYHSDALLTGHSSQNSAHIKMIDHIEVRYYIWFEGWGTCYHLVVLWSFSILSRGLRMKPLL